MPTDRDRLEAIVRDRPSDPVYLTDYLIANRPALLRALGCSESIDRGPEGVTRIYHAEFKEEDLTDE